MMVHLGQPPDLQALIVRAVHDEDTGHTDLALLRLADAHEAFPDHGSLLYLEGLVRQNRLGQGIRAYDLFTRAFKAARQGRGVKTTAWFSASNAALLAPDENAYRHWAQTADKSRPFLKGAEFARSFKALDAGLSFEEYQGNGAVEAYDRGALGLAASIVEVVLARAGGANEANIDRLQARAGVLRQLDDGEEQQRTFAGETFPPTDRLALREALCVMQQVVELNPYDAEAWNFISARQILLGKFKLACEAADRSIQLRPEHYPKPRTNKAVALLKLDRRAEACEEARTALTMARGSLASPGDSANDIRIAEGLIERACGPEVQPPLDASTQEFLGIILKGVMMAADSYAAQTKTSPRQLAKKLLGRCEALRLAPSGQHVAVVADLLMFFTPEVALLTFTELMALDSGASERLAEATIRLVADSSGAQSRDAARLLALFVLAAPNLAGIRQNYRLWVLGPEQAGGDTFSRMSDAIGQEFDRFSSELGPLITDQLGLDEMEKQAAREKISRLLGMQ